MKFTLPRALAAAVRAAQVGSAPSAISVASSASPVRLTRREGG